MAISDIRHKKIALFLGDLILLVVSAYLSLKIRFLFYDDVASSAVLMEKYTRTIPFSLFIYAINFYLFDLYNIDYKFSSTSFLSRFLIVVFSSSIVLAVLFYLFIPWKFGRGIYVINIFLVFIFTYLWRLLFQFIFSASSRPRTIGIVGAGESGKMIYDVLLHRSNYAIKGFFDDDPVKMGHMIGSHNVLGDSEAMIEIAKRGELDAIILAVTHEKSPQLIRCLVDCKMSGIEVYNMPTFYEDVTGKIPVIHLEDGWFVYTTFQGLKRGIYKTRIKRILDVAFSLVCIVMTAPLIIITAIAIKLGTAGPILFRQHRVGLNGKVFEIFKFRSMKDNAELNGAVWAEENDPRITRIGRIIRKLRVDEIPQIWNVLKGDMSFIGPRPERPEFVEKLNEEIPYYQLRHAIKPGITGWAQVNYRYGASKEDALEKLQYDIYYIKNMSAFLDLHILLRTLRVVFFQFGAR